MPRSDCLCAQCGLTFDGIAWVKGNTEIDHSHICKACEAMQQAETPLDKLKVLLYRNPATADPWTQSVYQVLFHAATEVSEPAIQQAILDHYEHYVRSLSSVIREAQEAGQIRNDVPAEWLAWQIIHAAVGFAMVRPLNIPSHTNMEFVQGTINLLMELLTHQTNIRSSVGPM